MIISRSSSLPSLPSLLWVWIWIAMLFSHALHAHEVKQLFLSLEKAGVEWELKSTFDAGYALPELRNDQEAPQPKREWLYQLDKQEHTRLRKETEAYLHAMLRFTHDQTDVPYQISFPDYQNNPPNFPTMLNGGAYITVLIKGEIKVSTPGDFQIHVKEGAGPDYIVASGSPAKRNYHVVTPGHQETLFTTQPGQTQATIHQNSIIDILWMGYRHVIPDGLDHLLFILALFLMAREWRPLLSQSLAFTVAHSITLALVSSGLLNLSLWPGTWLIEPLIALSIAIVAAENCWTDSNTKHRILIIFGFGLIHGLGFAGSLGTALDQANNHNLTALAFANLGVELAQITILALAWLLTMKWWQSDSYKKFRLISSLAIAVTGTYWFWLRLSA